MEDSRRTAVMFMHLSWRRKNKEKKGKGREAKRQGQGGGRKGCGAGFGLRRVALAASWACSQKARQTGEGWRLIWNNPAFRRLYAWRLWAMGL